MLAMHKSIIEYKSINNYDNNQNGLIQETKSLNSGLDLLTAVVLKNINNTKEEKLENIDKEIKQMNNYLELLNSGTLKETVWNYKGRLHKVTNKAQILNILSYLNKEKTKINESKNI